MDVRRLPKGDLLVVFVAFVVRALVLVWADGQFSPAADGVYYHTLAARIAAGLGSTWLWPDGQVTFAAHYPVGYPAILAIAYRVAGASPIVAGSVNAVLGTAAALAAYRLALLATTPRRAWLAGLSVALHPGLAMYTPAIMTEGVTAALWTIAAWMASSGKRGAWVAVGACIGVATLVRPQSLALAPCFGALAVAPGSLLGHRVRRAVGALVVALLVCAPWTVRNCVRMQKCALVSFNGGWNLLIGAHEGANGSYAPLEVPEACRTVWDEAEKDACFGREARRSIARAPARWLGLVPARLAATFDYSGAPGFYLHQSNPEAFGDHAKVGLGIVETVYERIAYLAALVGAAFVPGNYRRVRFAVAALSGMLLFQTHAYVAVLGLLLSLGLVGKRLFGGPVLASATFFALATTAVTHAVFFGSGRYSMVVFPLVTAFGVAWSPKPVIGGEKPILTAGMAGRDTGETNEEMSNAPDRNGRSRP